MERYLKIMTVGFIVFPFIALLITIPFIIHNYHKYGSINKLRTIIIYSFVLYLLCAYFFVILPLPEFNYVASLTTPKMQLIPGNFLVEIFTKSELIINNLSSYICFFKSNYFIQPLFNIVLTIPFGIYLHYYFNCSTLKTIFYSFLLSLFFEITQLSGLYFIYPRSYRLFDVDDLLLNTLGGFIGYYIANLFSKVLPNRAKIDEESYEDSKNVSGFRRITALAIDMFLVLFIIAWALIFGIDNKLTLFSLIIIGLLEIGRPLIKECSIGEKIVHIRAISLTNKKYKFIFYIVLKAFILFMGPFIIINIGNELAGILIVLYFFYYIIAFFKILFGHKLFFEKVLGIDFENTLLK